MRGGAGEGGRQLVPEGGISYEWGGGAAAPYAGSGAEVNISLSLTDTSFPICIELYIKLSMQGVVFRFKCTQYDVNSDP